MLHYIILHYTILYYYIVLYYIILCYIIPYYITLVTSGWLSYLPFTLYARSFNFSHILYLCVLHESDKQHQPESCYSPDSVRLL